MSLQMSAFSLSVELNYLDVSVQNILILGKQTAHSKSVNASNITYLSNFISDYELHFSNLFYCFQKL